MGRRCTAATDARTGGGPSRRRRRRGRRRPGGGPQQAGCSAVITPTHRTGAGFGAFPDATLCGGKGHDFVVTIPGVCLGHRAFHLLFNTAVSYTYPEDPAIGTLGEDVMATGTFDGGGCH